MSRRVNLNNSYCSTIAKFNNNSFISKSCDVLIMNECSTVSNEDMLKVLKTVNYKLLLLVGDTHQIESIRFGNWFEFAKEFVNKSVIYELTETFRSDNNKLLDLWTMVRTHNKKLLNI